MLSRWRRKGGNRAASPQADAKPVETDTSDIEASGVDAQPRLPKWSLGILNDRYTDEVPGSVLLLSAPAKRNEPLGLHHTASRTSTSSLPSPYPPNTRPSPIRRPSSRSSRRPQKKRTKDGKVILEPQPDDSLNDPLNWAVWRRDAALLSLGLYCMIGGGTTPLLAAGFKDVAATYGVSLPQVSLTTGLYMMGLGLGSVVASPTAILFGKRPVYLVAAMAFVLTSVWCAASPNYASLVVARIVQGMAVSPVECLPSATIAEIYFLHERAYRLGIYTLLLLGGKNVVPLVSAVVVQNMGWRWVFWLVAIIVGFCGILLFFFVPETFWDRTPRPHQTHHGHHSRISLNSFKRGRSHHSGGDAHTPHSAQPKESLSPANAQPMSALHSPHHEHRNLHVGFAVETSDDNISVKESKEDQPRQIESEPDPVPNEKKPSRPADSHDYFGPTAQHDRRPPNINTSIPPSSDNHDTTSTSPNPQTPYTEHYRKQPPKTFLASLAPFTGRLASDRWLHACIRPFILFAYPAVLWSALIYSLSIGWLIVLSESVALVYQDPSSYHFSPLQTGLVYISPFVGGILGTAVAGKVSDLIVRAMSRRNDGVYEPEFRLVMAVPVCLATTAGLMGFGWAAEERDAWIVPTVFFGVISFGCSLGSTTAITFCVDSYRQYAGEALVTLNFAKNIFHGLVFSFFFTGWLESDGSKTVFVAIGGIQLACLLFTIPMYIYGKRARIWTVRKDLMNKF